MCVHVCRCTCVCKCVCPPWEQCLLGEVPPSCLDWALAMCACVHTCVDVNGCAYLCVHSLSMATCADVDVCACLCVHILTMATCACVHVHVGVDVCVCA